MGTENNISLRLAAHKRENLPRNTRLLMKRLRLLESEIEAAKALDPLTESAKASVASYLNETTSEVKRIMELLRKLYH